MDSKALETTKCLINDSVFCLFEITKIFSTFEYSFRMNHSILGEIHERLCIWSSWYEVLKKIAENEEEEPYCLKSIKEDLAKLIEPGNLPFITKRYQCEKAILEYTAAIETHSQGVAYHNLIDNMYYLNDDFNDASFHFSIALERYKDSLSPFHKEVEELKKRFEESKIYQVDSYSKTEVDK